MIRFREAYSSIRCGGELQWGGHVSFTYAFVIYARDWWAGRRPALDIICSRHHHPWMIMRHRNPKVDAHGQR